MSEIIIDTYCGLSCATCEFKEPCKCGGCIATEGHPFHGGCEVAECAKSKGRRFCGECADFPCEILKRYSFDPEHGDNGERIEACKTMKTALVAEARKGVDPVSVCGFSCDHCPFGQWCGGCRSTYNCCSFATVCENGVCPNVQCAAEKKIDGCYLCDELEGCTKGFYKNDDGYVAKAYAVFIGRYRKELYTKSLDKAIAAGENLNNAGSVEKVIELLEKYINS